MHRLLERQIKRHLGSLATVPEQWLGFLNAIDQAYSQADENHTILERSIDLISSELMQANQQLRSVIPDLFLRLDVEGTIVDYQPGCLGEGSSSYLAVVNPLGQKLRNLLPAKAADRLEMFLGRAREDSSATAIEHEIEREGQLSFYEARVLRMVEGQAIIIVRNITERKQQESALQASEAKLRQQSEQLQTALAALKQAQTQLIQQEKMSSLGQLVAGVAHEINNPLSFILGNLHHLNLYTNDFVDLLTLYTESYPSPPDDIAQKIERIDLDFAIRDVSQAMAAAKNGAERIRKIVESLRSFARLDESSLKTIDLHEGLDSSLAMLQYRYAPHRPQITLQRQYGQLPEVTCYASQLNQVWVNLLMNAFDAIEAQLASSRLVEVFATVAPAQRSQPLADDFIAPQGRLVITTRYDPEREWVEIVIADNGVGVPEAVKAQIFDPFFTTKPIGKGTGMGLAVVHQVVVDRHGGSVSCQPRPGGGTEFRIVLPVRLYAVPGQELPPTPAMASRPFV